MNNLYYWLMFLLHRGRIKPIAFHSAAVEAKVVDVSRHIYDDKLRELFTQCLLNTLLTTIMFQWPKGRRRTVISTGDIPAMWLRDSAAQVWPYMRFITQDEPLRLMVADLIRCYTQLILLDPYANSFLLNPAQRSPHRADQVEWRAGVWERKWELDSLCYVVRLVHEYWRLTGDTSVFDERFHRAARLIVHTCQEQQRFEIPGPYSYQRPGEAPVPNDGYGPSSKYTGMVRTMFRPSDDIVQYPFLVASNLFAVSSSRKLAELAEAVWSDQPLARTSRTLGDQILAGVLNYGVVEHPRHGRIFAYETDGLGGVNTMDDANVPSLLSLRYLVPELFAGEEMHELYLNTRAFVLSTDNPHYYEGSAASGIGSPHTPQRTIWPMSIIMRALTSTDEAEIRQCLRWLIATDAGKGYMHESFHKNNPQNFTREWFGWANSLFGELILWLASEYPQLLEEEFSPTT